MRRLSLEVAEHRQATQAQDSSSSSKAEGRKATMVQHPNLSSDPAATATMMTAGSNNSTRSRAGFRMQRHRETNESQRTPASTTLHFTTF